MEGTIGQETPTGKDRGGVTTRRYGHPGELDTKNDEDSLPRCITRDPYRNSKRLVPSLKGTPSPRWRTRGLPMTG